MEHHDLLTTKLSSDKLKISGLLKCRGGYTIAVNKFLELDEAENGKTYARTYSYSYHCEKDGCPILRYDDSQHYPDHPDKHHKHNFDDCGHGTVIWVGEDNWPHLSQVVEEVAYMYEANLSKAESVTDSN